MSEKRKFNLGDVLSIVDGHLLSDKGMGGVYAILNHMTGDSLFTHQLPRACDECRPWLLRWFPRLAEVGAFPEAEVANLDPEGRGRVIKEWLARQAAAVGEWFDVPRIPPDDHARIDPVEEAEQMFGKERVVRLDLPAEEPRAPWEGDPDEWKGGGDGPD